MANLVTLVIPTELFYLKIWDDSSLEEILIPTNIEPL